jgi:hypothetical protein
MFLKGVRHYHNVVDIATRPLQEFFEELVDILLLMRYRSFVPHKSHVKTLVSPVGHHSCERPAFRFDNTLIVRFDLIK